MPLPETMFCAQQIKIPPELPDILKQFTKAAIRTQPRDVLQWAAAYFSALSKGEPLPVKERIEIPSATGEIEGGLTPGLLKVLHKKLSPKGMVTVTELKEKWKHLCLPEEQLKSILQLDNFGEEVEWMKILALGCSVLGGSLLSSMKHACEILTSEPEGGAAPIPFETFSFLYLYLASIDGEIPEDETEAFLHKIKEEAWTEKRKYMERFWVEVQAGRHHSPVIVTGKTDSTWRIQFHLLPIKSEQDNKK
ncbi:ropporin-1-like protein isoform X1 [Chiroxiphia lanceolata]|uniref:ropporin-1-like protein isoform X1 n=1 Tax=Corapipo altera TaxID=415028 RepID=UPI000FD67407|nr:ropporin-1-like protein isoform X1 [Corapipo altera]XP_027499899.1 ropporin-1-like protein isoform X1 [Corapipo altera]XP_027499900.1 ropporin-1-like protein isoform X1 [Corapipo altera]XP_027499902.1 ropporin-1-like protein isoform X1 [Corapipo altera]XP_027499903.1 ropporin-1-like protein isoform X1 [Corapipo altera]XP_027499904.1 ropporin-1-like protein isoform X1 [Corapipo altera]XP_027499905.1 ropporin-1-like protein isoform X1 [Corapipo altera]XP_032558133.1 ropporin-1-like protein 